MVLRWLFGWAAVSVVFVVAVALWPEADNIVQTIRTDEAQETGLGCTTLAGASSCSVVLAAEHAFAAIDAGGAVTETSPGSTDRTSTSDLAGDRQTVTVSGLSAATTYAFTVDYDVVVVDGPLGTVLNWAPWVLLLSVIGSLFAGLAAAILSLK